MTRVRCTARSKTTGEQCRKLAIPGGTTCRIHGGAAPQVVAAAERRLQREAAEAAVVTYGLPREIDPAQALIEEVHRTAGAVSWLGAIIADLDQDDLVWGVTEEIDRLPSYGDDGELHGGGVETRRKAVPNTWLQLYQQERKHLAAVSRDALGADAAGRVAAVFEQIGSTYVRLIERVLEGLDLTEEQRARVPAVVTRELQAIAGGKGS